MTDAELTEYRNRINAQVTALRVAVIAVIQLHPQRDAVAKALERATEHLMPEWLNSQLPDSFVSEFQMQMEDLLKRARSS